MAVIAFAAFILAAVFIIGLQLWAEHRDRIEEDQQRYELLFGPRSEAAFWEQYDVDELKQLRDEAC